MKEIMAPAAQTKKVSKSKFIRSLPRDLSNNEVVAKGKEAGLSFTAKYASTVRAEARKARKAKAGAKGVSQKGASTAAPLSTKKQGKGGTAKTQNPPFSPLKKATDRWSVEDVFRAVAAELGLARSIEILQSERAKVRSLLGS